MCLELTCLSAFAQKEVTIDNINYIIDSSDNTAIVGKNPYAAGDIIIPRTIMYEHVEYEIIEVGEDAFRGNLKEGSKSERENCKITSIELPEGLKVIGKNAFSGCDALFSITIPNSVRKIESDAFYKSGLTHVVLGSKLTKIGDFAFASTKLKKVNIPDNVTQIGHCAFEWCKKLTEVKIGNGLKTLPEHMFFECDELETVVLGNNIQKISSCAFSNCGALSEINFPQSLKEIDPAAIIYCPMLVSLRIPSGVRELNGVIISDCENFEKLILESQNTSFLTVGNQQWVVRNCPNFQAIYYTDGAHLIPLFQQPK